MCVTDLITPPARAPRPKTRGPLRELNGEKEPPPSKKRTLTAELTPRRRRKRRCEKREHIVPDPCQRAEQLRLLPQVLPELEVTMHEEGLPQLAPGMALELGDETWRVSRLLGSGAYSHVYRLTLDGERRFATLGQLQNGLQHGASQLWRRLSGGPTVGVAPRTTAAKVSLPSARGAPDPSQAWEWYLHEQMRRRLRAEALPHVLLGTGLHVFGGAVGDAHAHAHMHICTCMHMHMPLALLGTGLHVFGGAVRDAHAHCVRGTHGMLRARAYTRSCACVRARPCAHTPTRPPTHMSTHGRTHT